MASGEAKYGMLGKMISIPTHHKKKKKKRYFYVPKFACFRSNHEKNSIQEENKGVNTAVQCTQVPPTHLFIMVNGLIGSAQDWSFAAKQFLKKYPRDVIIHCSECNPSRLTFDGVDVMGDRLAQEVMLVVKCYPGVKKISFVGHSLGGLVARYAIARLYEPCQTREFYQADGDSKTDEPEESSLGQNVRGKIAGLEPMNFITFATPHLGSRGHKQVPAFIGSYALEKVASRASWFLGRTGKHLFCTDNDNGKPLLLQMVNDSEILKFISALKSFRRRVVYANVNFDYLVGWSTSSLRRRNELPKLEEFPKHDKYPHIVNVEDGHHIKSQAVCTPPSKKHKAFEMEEEMIKSLTKLSWERVDVKFSGRIQRILAHTTIIQIKTHSINPDGSDVILHMIDNSML